MSNRAQAVVLRIVMGVSALMLLGALSGWILPALVALCHGGWEELASTPRQEGIFPGPPAWMSPRSASTFSVIYGTLGIAGGFVGLYFAERLWQYLVVIKLHWMTESEVKEMKRREPGF
jgi:hypothetical protein